MPYSQYPGVPQPLPNNHEPTFEEKVLQALKGLKVNTQVLHSHTQSIVKLEIQIGQLATTFNRREEGKLLGQPINNPKGQYRAESSTSSKNFVEQAKAIMTLRSEKILNQPDLSQKCEIAEPKRKNNERKKEPIDQAPIPKAPFPRALKFFLPLEKKNLKMNEMLELFK